MFFYVDQFFHLIDLCFFKVYQFCYDFDADSTPLNYYNYVAIPESASVTVPWGCQYRVVDPSDPAANCTGNEELVCIRIFQNLNIIKKTTNIFSIQIASTFETEGECEAWLPVFYFVKLVL